MSTIQLSTARPGALLAGTLRRGTPRLARPDVARPVAAGGLPGGALRLTGRGRLVLLLLAALVVVVPILLGARGAAADGPQGAPQVERHVVEPGETLWRIASSIAAPGQDVRDVVHELVVLNGLPDSSLYAGETIAVPVGG